jgi:hypothetical protein
MVCLIQGTSSAPSGHLLHMRGEGKLGQYPKYETSGLVVPSLLHAVEKVPNGRMRSFS